MNRLQRLRRLGELRARQHAIAGARAQLAAASLRQAEQSLQQCSEERQRSADRIRLAVAHKDQDAWLNACAESDLTLVRQHRAARHLEHAAFERERLAKEEIAARRMRRQMESAVEALTAKTRLEQERRSQQQLDETMRFVSRHLLLGSRSA